MPIYFGDKIREARKAAGLTQRQLAGKIGSSNTTVSNWEKNISRPDPDAIQSLCWALQVRPDYFFPVGAGEEATPIGVSTLPTMRSIPLLGTIACGDPILAEENVEDYLEAPEEIKADFCLRCKGDSMINARIFDGDIVYIRRQPTVNSGEIAAVLIDGEATLKRIRIYDDHVSLEPENPQYRPIVLWGAEMNTVRIIGRAVAFTSVVR